MKFNNIAQVNIFTFIADINTSIIINFTITSV